MLLAFTKMHGLGNDFVVLDGVRQSFSLTPAQIRKIADRRFGIGCDQVLVVAASDKKNIDFRYRIFNADGGEVEQCGNGARCFARFVREKGLTDKSELAVETLSGIIYPTVEADGQVRVNMGVPQFDPAHVPFQAERRQPVYNLDIGGEIVPVSVLSVGNPHAVQIVEDVERAPVTSQGPLIENHVRFPQRGNAGYMQIIDRTHIRLRVYERGTGETLACGSGACAAVVAGRLRHLLDDTVEVAVRGGRLRIFWQGEGEPVWMTGPATTVYDGSINLDNL
ncbi:MAG TPA: diaminopimelate epimerase [Acidiferrobacterales bacterium]|nr:diaminopimelate epimerase [Acidiferrobacterales bacterium]